MKMKKQPLIKLLVLIVCILSVSTGCNGDIPYRDLPCQSNFNPGCIDLDPDCNCWVNQLGSFQRWIYLLETRLT